jgi:signal transduction histidine kinase
MRTLFQKLFLWFLLTTILSGVVFFVFAFNLRMAPMREQHLRNIHEEQGRAMTQALLLAGRATAALYEQGGSAALSALQQQGHPPALYLLTTTAIPLSEATPAQVSDAARAYSETGRTGPHGPAKGAVMVARITAPSGSPYLIATQPPFLPGSPELPLLPLPPDFWLQMLITLAVSSLVCSGLSWHITAPVRNLRLAVQKFARGDLGTRFAVASSKTGDELLDLGRDFNLMAIRIEKLVNAHRQLVRDISHEFRSPLARLNVAMGIASSQSGSGQTVAFDRMEQESERLDALVGELLTLSKLDGGVTVEKSVLNLSYLAEEIAGDALFESSGSNRHFDFLIEAPQLLVEGNRDLLRRAIENVCRNAMRYTPEGSAVQLRVAARDGWAVVSLRDFGPGVPEDQLAAIFQPFYRVEQARDRKRGGTGIGLAISEKAIALHGGSIQASNLPDGGLKVEIRIPLTETP